VRLPFNPAHKAVLDGVAAAGLTLPLSNAASRELSATMLGRVLGRQNGETNSAFFGRLMVEICDHLPGVGTDEIKRLVAEALCAHVAAQQPGAPLAAVSGG